MTGRAVERNEALLVPNALECEFAYRIPGTAELEESLAVVPLRYGSRVTGAIVISKLGVDQFDDDDIRLLEVLPGQASVALENARLYEQQRREAEGAKALLAFTAELQHAQSYDDIYTLTVQTAPTLFETQRASLWLGDVCVAAVGEPLADGAERPADRERRRRRTHRRRRPGARRRPRPPARRVRRSRVRSRCRRRASTGSNSRPQRSRARCSRRAATWRPPSRPTTCSLAAWR